MIYYEQCFETISTHHYEIIILFKFILMLRILNYRFEL